MTGIVGGPGFGSGRPVHGLLAIGHLAALGLEIDHSAAHRCPQCHQIQLAAGIHQLGAQLGQFSRERSSVIRFDREHQSVGEIAIVRNGQHVGSGLFGLGRTPDGWFAEAHPKLRPVEMASRFTLRRGSVLGREQETTEEVRDHADLLPALDEMRQAVLLGEPGIGKTTTLYKFADLISTRCIKDPAAPDVALGSAISQACAERGLLVLTCGAGNVVRWIPPLDVERSEIEEALGVFQQALLDTRS